MQRFEGIEASREGVNALGERRKPDCPRYA